MSLNRGRLRAAVLLPALVAAAYAVPAGTAAAAFLPAGSTAILSGAPSLFEPLPTPVSPSSTSRSSVSQDGRVVAFVSFSDGLVADDDDTVQNVYVKDRATGAVTLVSRSTGAAGAPSHDHCADPAISDDGSRVAFTCEGPLDAADGNGDTDVYVRDLRSASTLLASRGSGLGPAGDAGSYQPALNDDGRYVAFASQASNLDPTHSGGGENVYRRDLAGAGATVLVSRRSAVAGGAQVEGKEPSISDSGDRVAFTSHRAIDPADGNLTTDVYVRDMAGLTTTLASRADGSSSAVGNGPSGMPALAGDGTAVAFESRASNFDLDHDRDSGPDVYRRSLTAQTTALVGVNLAGAKGGNSTSPSIDDSGQVVSFVSTSNALDPDDGDPTADAYVKNLQANTLAVASRADGPAGAVANADARSTALSGDGKSVAVTLLGTVVPGADPRRSTVMVREPAAGRTRAVARPAGNAPFVNQGGRSSGAALSADGRHAAFASDAPALGLPAGAAAGVFVRDRLTGAVTLASRADGPDGAPLAVRITTPAISADGRRVAFVAGTGSQRGVWVRDLAAGRTWLASRADGADGQPANDSASEPALDADGSRVAFSTAATNLGDGAVNAVADVHVRDLDTGRTVLVSRADGPAGAEGGGGSSRPSLSADGNRVLFVSDAANLGDGDADAQADVHVRDLPAGRTLLASAAPDGTKSNAAVASASLDATGARVAFSAPATNLLGQAGPGFKVFVRDLAGDALVLASRADGREGEPATDAVFPVISPDGGYVAFASSAGSLAPGGPTGVVQAYRRVLAAGRTQLVSRRTGPAGTPAGKSAYPDAISAGGACVSFSTGDALLGPPSDYGQAYLRAVDANCGDVVDTPGDGGGPGGDPAGGTDTTAPVISDARLTRKRFRAGPARARARTGRVRRGSVLRLRSSERATLTLAFHRVSGKRRKPAGSLARAIASGPGKVRLTGRIGRRRMAAGRYRLTLTARDAAGNRSRPVRLRLRIVR